MQEGPSCIISTLRLGLDEVEQLLRVWVLSLPKQQASKVGPQGHWAGLKSLLRDGRIPKGRRGLVSGESVLFPVQACLHLRLLLERRASASSRCQGSHQSAIFLSQCPKAWDLAELYRSRQVEVPVGTAALALGAVHDLVDILEGDALRKSWAVGTVASDPRS